jgi:uncharacterized protein DUF4345
MIADKRWIRLGLILLAVPLVVTGAWALFAPESWYDDFPGSGRHWITPLGPYNEHLIRDVGAGFLGQAILALWAAIVLERRLVQAAALMALAFALPHFIFHLSTMDEYSTSDNVLNMTALGISVLLPAALLYATRKSDATA